MAVHIMRVFKSVVGEPEKAWVNTYEADLVAPLGYVDAEAYASVLVAAEAEMHLGFVQFDRVTVSTWAPDSKPYNPTALYTFSGFGITGQAIEAGDPENLDTVLWVKRIATSGRNGRVFYRGVLVDSDTQENAKKRVGLTSIGRSRTSALVEAFKNTFSEAEIAPTFVMQGRSLVNKIYEPAGLGQKQKVTKVYSDPHTRFVVNWVVGDATRAPMDNAYFDVEE